MLDIVIHPFPRQRQGHSQKFLGHLGVFLLERLPLFPGQDPACRVSFHACRTRPRRVAEEGQLTARGPLHDRLNVIALFEVVVGL